MTRTSRPGLLTRLFRRTPPAAPTPAPSPLVMTRTLDVAHRHIAATRWALYDDQGRPVSTAYGAPDGSITFDVLVAPVVLAQVRGEDGTLMSMRGNLAAPGTWTLPPPTLSEN